MINLIFGQLVLRNIWETTMCEPQFQETPNLMGLECLFESMKQFSVEVSRIQIFGSIGGSPKLWFSTKKKPPRVGLSYPVRFHLN